MNYDEFVERFKPIGNHIDSNASFEGKMFETYGPEEAFVFKQEPDKVWTYVAIGRGYILPGRHMVNRMGYFVTEVSHHDRDELEVVLEDECIECCEPLQDWHDSDRCSDCEELLELELAE